MKFSLSRQCTLRPDFTGAPGLNTPISFEDVARHRVRKWVVLDALRHLFNLRFYTDEETRTVYVEPADDFYRLGQTLRLEAPGSTARSRSCWAMRHRMRNASASTSTGKRTVR